MGRLTRWTLLVAAIAITAVLSVSGTEYSAAHEFPNGPYRWTSSYWPTIHDLNSSFNSYVSAAAADYNSNTAGTVYTCSSGGCGNWDATDAALGGSGPLAQTTLTLNGSTITSAYTEWNYNVSQPNRDHVARHEVGHGFGMYHVECSTSSVMWGPCDEPWPSSLQSHDTGHMNAWY